MPYQYIRTIFNSLFCLLYVLITSVSSAQVHPNYFQLTKKNGLPSNTIYYLHGAKNGLIYVGHSKGLSHFDGNVFHEYYFKEYPYTEVTNIMETDQGEIYCEAFNNMLLHIENDTLIKTTYYTNKFGYTPSTCYKNTIISSSNDSIVFFNTLNKKRLAKPNSTASLAPFQGQYVFTKLVEYKTSFALLCVNENFDIFIDTNHFNQLSNQHFNNGQCYFAKDKSIERIYHLNNETPFSIKPKNKNTIVNYIVYTHGYTWICTTNGLYYFNEQQGISSLKYILKNFNISCISFTFENNLLISTLEQGLLFIPSFDVNTLPNIPEKISSINGTKTQLLLGTQYGELYKYDLNHNASQLKLKLPNQKAINTILVDTKHQLNILGSFKTYFQFGTNTIEREENLKDYTYINSSLLLATHVGLYLLAEDSLHHWINSFVSESNSIPHFKKLSFFNEFVASVKYNPRLDCIYLNTYAGIFEFKKGDTVPQILKEPRCVLKDMCVYNGELLLASKDKGILKWNGQDYVNAFPKDSLKGQFLKFEIYKNELWIIAEDAIYAYIDLRWHKYDQRIGLSFENKTKLFITDSMAYVADGTNIVQFPKILASEKTNSPLFICHSIQSNKEHNSINTKAALSHTNNSITLRYSLIAFANAANTHLAYIINNQAPIHVQQSTREISFTNLNPDHYQIKLFTVIDNQLTTTPIYEFEFTILPPFYKRWWFTLFLVAAGGLIVFLISKRILNNWKREALQKETQILLEKELDKSMLSSIKAQMNPHFLFNALNTIQSYIYSNDKHNASLYISKFSSLTRSILEMSTKDTITLDEEIKSLTLYLELEKMRFEDSFHYSIQVEAGMAKEHVRIPSMLVQPYVENAIKHGLLHKKSDRELMLHFSKEGQLLKIVIDDNGIGRKRSQELNHIKNRMHTSFAMNANKKRLEILKNNFTDIELEIIDKMSPLGEASGTQVIIRLPI